MSKENPVIAVDMLGVDKGKPGKVECKALKGILKEDLFPEAKFILVGCREQIIKALKGLIKTEKNDNGEMRFVGRVINVIDAPEKIDSSLRVLDKEELKKAKTQNSAVKKCYDLVDTGDADALVSCSHTGFQAHLASTKLRRMNLSMYEENKDDGKKTERTIRPGLSISATVPNPDEEHATEFSDMGASLPPEDVFEKTQQLILKALMALPLGTISKKRVNPEDTKRPKLFILSNGTEPEKAPKAVQYTHTVLEKFKDFFNYGGLTEPSFFKKKDDMEIVITDGFTGNIALKSMEDVGKGMKWSLGSIIKKSILWWRSIGYLILRKAFKPFSPDNHAGGLIYGVNKIAVKSHGSSTPEAVTVAIGKTVNFVKEDVLDQTRKLFEGLPKEIADVVTSVRKLADMLEMDGEKIELERQISSLSETASKEVLKQTVEFMQHRKAKQPTQEIPVQKDPEA